MVTCDTVVDPMYHTQGSVSLKVVSATFLLVSFVSVKESTSETSKNVFYSPSKAFFVLEIIKFELFRYSNVIMSSNAQA